MKKSNELTDLVKKIQYLTKKTIEEVASSIGYSRVHLSKQMKIGNKDLQELLYKEYADILQNEKYTPPPGPRQAEQAMFKVVINELIKLQSVVYGRSIEDLKREFRLNTNLIIDELKEGEQ